MAKKLQDVASRITEKEKMHADLAIKNARESMASMSERKGNPEGLMVNGYQIEEEQK